MDYSSSTQIQDDTERRAKDEIGDSFQPKVDTRDNVNNWKQNPEGIPGNRANSEGDQKFAQDSAPANVDASGDVNMEAFISSDDVIRAGGLGARDDLNTLLPVAVDMTDFEATLRDARDYEDSQEKISRPGLGWRETSK